MYVSHHTSCCTHLHARRWRAQLMRVIFRPRRFVLDWVTSRRAHSADDTLRASVHVRNGDKSHGNSVQACVRARVGSLSCVQVQ
jgi:hypothetical protein